MPPTETLPAVENLEIDGIPIPTIEDIERKGYRHQHPSGVPNITIYKLKYLVKKSLKHTHDRLPAEIATLRFLNEHTTIPVPKVLAVLKADDGITTYLVMNYIPAPTLQQAWPTLTGAEKEDVAMQLRKHLDQLHALTPPSPTYFGGVNGGPLPNDLFCVPDQEDSFYRGVERPDKAPLGFVPDKVTWRYGKIVPEYKFNGPFFSEEEWISALHARCFEYKPKGHRAMMKMMRNKFYGHRSVFSHGDIQLKNILLERVPEEEREDEYTSPLRITLIDWEAAGFYPEFWDFCISTFVGMGTDWVDYVDRAMKPYWDEYPLFGLLFRMIGHPGHGY